MILTARECACESELSLTNVCRDLSGTWVLELVEFIAGPCIRITFSAGCREFDRPLIQEAELGNECKGNSAGIGCGYEGPRDHA
jgi:hypothetical protein